MKRSTAPPIRAISIRQPHAEAILRGTKKRELRKMPTNIRETVWIYASRKADGRDARYRIEKDPEDLPRGVIVGTVDIVGCRKNDDPEYKFAYILKNPRRLPRVKRPTNDARPVFWRPVFA